MADINKFKTPIAITELPEITNPSEDLYLMVSRNEGSAHVSYKMKSSTAGKLPITVIDALTSTSGTSALSANQGFILNGLIGQINNRFSNYYTKSETYGKDEIYNKSELYNKNELYTKSELYNKTQIDNMIGGIGVDIFVPVQALPATGEANKIYLLPSNEPSSSNLFEEWIWVDNNWELLGSMVLDGMFLKIPDSSNDSGSNIKMVQDTDQYRYLNVSADTVLNFTNDDLYCTTEYALLIVNTSSNIITITLPTAANVHRMADTFEIEPNKHAEVVVKGYGIRKVVTYCLLNY